VNIVFSEFDITDLPSGNYLVQIQVKNKKNELLGEQNVFFQRFNKNSIGELENIALLNVNNTFAMDISADSLTFFLKSLYPKAEAYEREYILRVIQKNDAQIIPSSTGFVVEYSRPAAIHFSRALPLVSFHRAMYNDRLPKRSAALSRNVNLEEEVNYVAITAISFRAIPIA